MCHMHKATNNLTTRCNMMKLPLLLNWHLTYLCIRKSFSEAISDNNLQTTSLTSPHGWYPWGMYTIKRINSLRQDPSIYKIYPNTSQLCHSIRSRPQKANHNWSITPEGFMRFRGVEKTPCLTLEGNYQEHTHSVDTLSGRFKTFLSHSKYHHIHDSYS